MDNGRSALGDKVLLRTNHGPVSFGLMTGASIVSWSNKGSKDLLVSRFWEGIYLYSSDNMDDIELEKEPIKVCGSIVGRTMGISVDWNRDGREDLLVADRCGFLYLFERKGDYPHIHFDNIGMLKDKETGAIFNIPFENPNHSAIDSLGGYDEPAFSNYLDPIVYPDMKSGAINLIIGDTSGNLWWMPDLSIGKGKPEFTGVAYEKQVDSINTSYGRELIKKCGNTFVKPKDKINDENGVPFLLGEGVDGDRSFQGGCTRPVLYKNNYNGTDDLIVIAGAKSNKFIYLKRINTDNPGKPSFQNIGDIKFENFDFGFFSCHSHGMIIENDGWNDLFISVGNKIAVFKNKKLQQELPEFAFDRWVSGKDVITSGYNFKEILEDEEKKNRYIVDSDGSGWVMRKITNDCGTVKLSSDAIQLTDQNGKFTVEGETDPVGGKDWGFHRAIKWDFDTSGKQHLIIGTDKGLLYLLIDDGCSVDTGYFKYRSAGPLIDIYGNVIKIHNRACPAVLDLNGDGKEDLLVGGASYQRGIETDPCPGGGVYCLVNKGVGKDGIPMLEPAGKIAVKGYELKIGINNMVEVQAVDINNDGMKEIIIGSSGDNWYQGRIFKLLCNSMEIEYIGDIPGSFSVIEHIMDIDGDSKPEFIFAGGEPGVGYYQKMNK